MNELLALAKEHLRKVSRSGPDDIMAICPFHRKADGQEEKTGSFSMSIRTGLWYCHSCHEKGSLSLFLRNVGVPAFHIESRYKYLIEETNKYRPAAPDPLRPTPVVNINTPLEESWLGLFDQCPVTLVEDDGFPEHLLQMFDIGFDEKHNRITFPLRDWRGTLYGISGRAVGNTRPRYKLYDKEYLAWGLPERTTEKRQLLWNAHNVFKHLKTHPDEKYVVIVEGFKACMRAVQAGLHNTVALLGSYISLEQKWLIEKMGVPAYVMLDNNDAGLKGRLYVCTELMKSLPVHLVEYDYEVQQPSDLDPYALCDYFFEAPNFSNWYIEKLRQP